MVSSTSYFHQGRCSLSLPLSLFLSLFFALFLSVTPFPPRESCVLSFSALCLAAVFHPSLRNSFRCKVHGRRTRLGESADWRGDSVLFAHDVLALKTFASRCTACASRLALKQREGRREETGRRGPFPRFEIFRSRSAARLLASHAAIRIAQIARPDSRRKERKNRPRPALSFHESPPLGAATPRWSIGYKVACDFYHRAAKALAAASVSAALIVSSGRARYRYHYRHSAAYFARRGERYARAIAMPLLSLR